MGRLWQILSGVIVALFLAFTAPCYALPAPDLVIAAIEGEPITASDLRHYARSVGEELPPDLRDGGDRVKALLKQFVMDKLLEKEAEQANITVEQNQVDAYVAEVKKQNRVDDEAFRSMLKAKGLTEESYREQVRSDILKTRLLQAKVRSHISVTDEDIDRALEQAGGPAPAQGRDGIEIDQISRKFEEGSDREALRAEIEAKRGELIDRGLDTGEEWQKVDPDHYQSLGIMERDNLREEFQDGTRP